MSRDFTPKEISELMLLSADDALVAINKRMNEPVADCRTLVYPEYGTEYWVITDRVRSTEWYDTANDTAYFDSGNYYATEEEADLEYEWRELNTRILNTIASLNKEENWVVDWTNKGQEKFSLYYHRREGSFLIPSRSLVQSGNDNEYFSYASKAKLPKLYTNDEFKFWITKERA